jgi:hypothetical protein
MDMDANMNPFGFAGEAVPSADPADMRKVWEFHLSQPSNHATGRGVLEQLCPGADVRVVSHRTKMLQMLKASGSLTPWLHEGRLDDAVFTIAATFPMKGMQLGTVYEEFPMDVPEFLRQVEKARGK